MKAKISKFIKLKIFKFKIFRLIKLKLFRLIKLKFFKFEFIKPKFKFTEARAFSLIELLVVVAIIGLLASITLPALKGIRKPNSLMAANRQLLDDLSLARLLAINNRTTVYVAFLGPQLNRNQMRQDVASLPTINRKKLRRLWEGVYSGYCIYARRSVGSQPGRPEPKYLTDWKYLPEGILFDPRKFDPKKEEITDPIHRSHASGELAFFSPEASPGIYTIAFNSQGQLESGRNEWISYVEGSVEFRRDDLGNVIHYDVINKTELRNRGKHESQKDPPRLIRINYLTGRASVERIQ